MPTSNTASHDNHEKINSWVSFPSYMSMGICSAMVVVVVVVGGVVVQLLLLLVYTTQVNSAFHAL